MSTKPSKSRKTSQPAKTTKSANGAKTTKPTTASKTTKPTASMDIPTPGDVENQERNEQAEQLLGRLVAELKRRRPGDRGDNPITTDLVPQSVQDAVVAALEEKDWSVTVRKTGGGCLGGGFSIAGPSLEWYIRPKK